MILTSIEKHGFTRKAKVVELCRINNHPLKFASACNFMRLAHKLCAQSQGHRDTNEPFLAACDNQRQC